MKKKRNVGTRILTFLLAFSMAASTLGTVPVYAMEAAAVNVNTEAAGQEAAQSEIQSEPEDIQEDTKEEMDTADFPVQKKDSGNIVEGFQNELEENSGNPEQPRAPADELPVAGEDSDASSEIDTERTDTFAVNIAVAEHGEILAVPETAVEGETVTVIVKAEEGYRVKGTDCVPPQKHIAP